MVNTLYISAAGTVSLDFRDAGKITSILLVGTNGAIGAGEVSFNSSSSLATNDTTGVIAGIVMTASGGPVSVSTPMSEQVEVGERIFLHSTGANTVRAFIYTDVQIPRASVRRR